MDVPLQRSGAIGRIVIALGLGLCAAAQAGMQLQPQPQPAEPVPKGVPAPAPAAAPKSRPGTTPAASNRPDERTAWPPCIRLINAAALGAAIDAERRQALLEQCAP